MPAMMPAVSWSPASEGPMVSTVGSVSNDSGSAPYLQAVGQALGATAWVKLPLIWAWPSGIRPFMVGAEITWPSSTIANCFSVPTSACEISANVVGAVAVEVEGDDLVDVVLRDAGRGVVEVGALDHRGGQQVLVALVVQVTTQA